ncbi:hypothetical protein PHPALM_1992 [Phytophthora palmivora]|uniref:Uncharacterized protein n=1 Tax=Phytophthora palmivora TaxID=4796 RepID=A0A2P4YQV2_9STRA|nr:hypothetical protein PHPALM_1992 [Phytophthora palmivora]
MGTMKIWVAEDKSMAALTVSGNCDSDDWSVVMDMNKSVNTGTCIASDDAAGVKYVLVENLLIGNTPISTPIPTRDESKVSVFTGHDDPSCNEPSTATIREGGCGDTDLFECTQMGTYYGQCTCSSSRDDYLQSAFKNSGVFMIEYYNDVNCNKLVSTYVYRADGKCHYFTFGVMKIRVAQDNSMAALLASTNCESKDWYVALDLNVSVNTGACIPNNDYFSNAEKYVFVGDPSSNTLPTPNSSNYGKRLWPDRGHSLCTREFGATNMCRDFDDGLSGTYLLQLSNQLFQHKQLMTAYLPQNGFYGISELPSPPEHLLLFYILVNRRVFNLWKVACIRNYNPTHPQELEYCQCVNQQLIHGISIARRIQHLIGQYELDSEWCELLKQRDEMLYQEAHSVLSDLCDRDLRERFYKQRRAFLDNEMPQKAAGTVACKQGKRELHDYIHEMRVLAASLVGNPLQI